MITIEHLEVQFDVAGDGDEAVFARYFNRYINQWSRAEKQQARAAGAAAQRPASR